MPALVIEMEQDRARMRIDREEESRRQVDPFFRMQHDLLPLVPPDPERFASLRSRRRGQTNGPHNPPGGLAHAVRGRNRV